MSLEPSSAVAAPAPALSPLPGAQRVEVWKPNLNLEQRFKVLRQLLLGMPMFEACEEEQLEDLLDNEHVLDRWKKVLLENLPECPWTGVHTLPARTPKRSFRHVVDVVRIDYEDLTAYAVVLGEVGPEGDISACVATPPADTPSREIPLEELVVFPTDTILKHNLDRCNTVLNCLKFFKKRLWFAFDEFVVDDGDCGRTLPMARKEHGEGSLAVQYFVLKYERPEEADPADGWIGEHLRRRMAVYSDYLLQKNNVYPALKRLSKEFEARFDGLESVEFELMKGGLAESVLDCWAARDKIEATRRKAAVLESPDLRAAAARIAFEEKKKNRRASSRSLARNEAPQVALVWAGGSAAELAEFQAAAESPARFSGRTARVVFKATLQLALDDFLRGDTIVLPRGTHFVSDWGEFRFGGSLCGVDVQESIVEFECVDDAKPFSIIVEGCCSFENLTMKPDSSRQCHGVVVREGSVGMRSCRLNEFDVGCKVMAGASLDVDLCSFSLGRVGLVVEKGAKVTAATFDVFAHDFPFVIKDRTGSGLDFKAVGTDFVQAHTTVVVGEEEGLGPGDVLDAAAIRDSPEITENREEGIVLVKEFIEVGDDD